MSTVPEAVRGPGTPPVPVRVSRMRAGVSDDSAPSMPATEASVYQPPTSTITSVEPAPL